MFDSDADRLAQIKALGGQLIQCGSLECWAIFDAAFSEVLGDPSVETSSPALSAIRTSDVVALGIQKEVDITTSAGPFRVRRVEPDGTGMSIVLLKRA